MDKFPLMNPGRKLTHQLGKLIAESAIAFLVFSCHRGESETWARRQKKFLLHVRIQVESKAKRTGSTWCAEFVVQSQCVCASFPCLHCRWCCLHDVLQISAAGCWSPEQGEVTRRNSVEGQQTAAGRRSMCKPTSVFAASAASSFAHLASSVSVAKGYLEINTMEW